MTFTYDCPTKANTVVSKTHASVSMHVCKGQELREPQTPECMILIHRLEQFRDSSPVTFPAFPLPISSPPTERQKEPVVIAASKEQIQK